MTWLSEVKGDGRCRGQRCWDLGGRGRDGERNAMQSYPDGEMMRNEITLRRIE